MHFFSVFCLWARHLPHSHRVYPIRKVGGVGGPTSCAGFTGQRNISQRFTSLQRRAISQGCALPVSLPAYGRGYVPLEAVHDALHRCRRPTRGGGGGDNVRSHCISLCSLIIYPCRQRRCHICIQLRRRWRRRRTCKTRVRFVDISPACLF